MSATAFKTYPPPVMEVSEEGDELLEVAMGPHHPSTHGVFRMDVALDGERVVRLKPVFGYLHRNHEKIAEKASYLASMPYTDRSITSARSPIIGPTPSPSRSSSARRFPNALSTCA